VGVEKVADDGGEYVDVKHRHDADESTDAEWPQSNDFLNDFKAKEKVTSSLHLQHVQVYGMQRVNRAADADKWKICGGLMPLGTDEAIEQWLGNSTKEEHADGCHKHRGLYHFPVSINHPLLVVLYVAQHGVGHPLNDIGQIA